MLVLTLPKVSTSWRTIVQDLWVYIPKGKAKYNYHLRIEREWGIVKSEIREQGKASWERKYNMSQRQGNEAKPHGKGSDVWKKKYNMRQALWSPWEKGLWEEKCTLVHNSTCIWYWANCNSQQSLSKFLVFQSGITLSSCMQVYQSKFESKCKTKFKLRNYRF